MFKSMCFLKKGLVALSLFAISGSVLAAADVNAIADQVTSQMDSIAVLLVVAAYVAGVGFALLGITQFKAHKDNPQQTPISKPIVYLIISACLLFLPTLMSSAGESVFGGSTGATKQAGSTDFSAADVEN